MCYLKSHVVPPTPPSFNLADPQYRWHPNHKTSNHIVFTCYLPLSLSLNMTLKNDSCLGVLHILSDITLFNNMTSLDDESHPAVMTATSLLGSIVSDCAGICAASLLTIGNCV